MKLVFKGFLIGLGKIIPGVSGAMIAMSLGMYEEIIEKLANIKTEFKDSAKYLLKPSIGIFLAIIIMSKIIVKCLNDYYFTTMLLFIGMITGGVIKSIKKIKLKNKKIILPIIAILLIIIAISKYTTIPKIHIINYSIEEFTKLIGIGVIDAASSIIPGISGTAILMSLGYYNTILDSISTILEIKSITKNIFIITPFIIGFAIGIILISKIINKIIKKYKETINHLITLFMILTLIRLIKNSMPIQQTILTYVIGIISFTLGMYISIKLEK